MKQCTPHFSAVGTCGTYSNMKQYEGGAKAAHGYGQVTTVCKCKEASSSADQLFEIITAVLLLG
jgi:hypothetical protein